MKNKNYVEKKVKYVDFIPNGYKINAVADISDIIKNMFGFKVKKAYAIVESLSYNNVNEIEGTKIKNIKINPDSIETDVFIIFDDLHKVLISCSEWMAISVINK